MQPTRRELLCGSLATMLALQLGRGSGAAWARQEGAGSAPLDIGSPTPLAPEYKQIADSTQELVELAFLKAAASQADPGAYPLPSDPNSLERICLRFLEGMQKTPSRTAKTVPQKAVGLLKSPKFANRSGKLSRVTLNTQTPVLVQARQQKVLLLPRTRTMAISKGISIEETRDRLLKDAGVFRPGRDYGNLSKFKKPAEGASAGNQAPPPPPGATQLLLNLRSLKCSNLVNMELTDIGSNTIALGGLGASSSGQQLKIGSFAAGTFNREPQTKNYSPDRTFARFDLTGNAMWPRTFNVVIAAAEKDADGGFVTFLHNLWDGISEIVTELVTAAVSAAAGTGATVGAVAGTAATPGIGTAIGAIIGAVLAGTIAFIVSVALNSLKDDLFDPVSLPTFILPDPSSRFANGGRKSDPFTVQLPQESGLYELSCQWELVGV